MSPDLPRGLVGTLKDEAVIQTPVWQWEARVSGKPKLSSARFTNRLAPSEANLQADDSRYKRFSSLYMLARPGGGPRPLFHARCPPGDALLGWASPSGS